MNRNKVCECGKPTNGKRMSNSYVCDDCFAIYSKRMKDEREAERQKKKEKRESNVDPWAMRYGGL